MTDREFFLARRKVELPAFVNVLKALPADKLDYKPHPNSPSAQQLAWLLAGGAEVGGGRVREGGGVVPDRSAPDHAAIVAAFEKNYADLVDARFGAWTRRPGRSRRSSPPGARS